MKFKRNFSGQSAGRRPAGQRDGVAPNGLVDMYESELVVDVKDQSSPGDYPLWYKQFLKLSSRKRREAIDLALDKIKEKKPETYSFIKNFKCELIGVAPNSMYALPDDSEGDPNVTWVHGYSMVTLKYWCPSGGFEFSVNANLSYNDTVLNSVKGNKRHSLRGLSS